MIDHLSYTHNLSSCEIKDWKILGAGHFVSCQSWKKYGRFYTRDALPVWTSFGKHLIIRPVIRLYTFSLGV